ncbi:hypothetical protein BDF20DRAFT_850012 [Mycotypha africana]|uniref:uncharacterized protein n=1 Tax=Mycotypha africana TaxID=64632 RepID=UPI002300B1C3|nr:uncharacterized protein BDF20DRAFT_850012 [Mycotypha africana]KAI8987395.1 hypothetical protein BDF20DRAFT_850012 [Mycotypha africana]
MTHLSDFSYIQRCALEIYLCAYLLYSIWSNDRFKCLHPQRVFSGELRSVVTIVYLMVALMQLSWDAISTWIKYQEKFVVIPNTTHVVTKPFDYWTNQHKMIAQSIDYVECVNLSLQTGVFFLLQCFWNYLSNSVAKKSFMSSWEFKFYIFWALGSMAIFPVLQWYFRKDVHMRETAPQLAYSIEVLICSLLGIRSHFRFKRLLNISQNLKHGAAAIVEKLGYFKDMNIYLTVVLFFYGSGLCILCVDGLTEAKIINSSKFGSDLLAANLNTGSVLLWLITISIFHPRQSSGEPGATMDSMTSPAATSNSHYNNNGSRFGLSGISTGEGKERTGIDVEMNHTPHNRIMNGSSISEGFFNTSATSSQRLSQRITNFIENKNNGNLRFGTLTAATNNSNKMTINETKTMYGPSPTTAAAATATAKELLADNNGSFFRPMSPMEVDYPSAMMAEDNTNSSQLSIRRNNSNFTPTHYFNPVVTSSPNSEPSSSNYYTVDDPYSKRPINFTMVHPATSSAKIYNHQSNGRPSNEGGSYRSISPTTHVSDGNSNGRYPQQQQDYPLQTISGAVSHRYDFKHDFTMTEDQSFDYLVHSPKMKH